MVDCPFSLLISFVVDKIRSKHNDVNMPISLYGCWVPSEKPYHQLLRDITYLPVADHTSSESAQDRCMQEI
jgi:hypothetical protein